MKGNRTMDSAMVTMWMDHHGTREDCWHSLGEEPLWPREERWWRVRQSTWRGKLLVPRPALMICSARRFLETRMLGRSPPPPLREMVLFLRVNAWGPHLLLFHLLAFLS